MDELDGQFVDSRGNGPQTSHQFVLDSLRRAIVSGELAGGTRLIQGELAGQLGVSTTPVREALRDLAAEGLIRLDAHRGALVHEVDADEFDQIYEMRLALEPLAIQRSITRITRAELIGAASFQELAEQECEPHLWVALNRRFHDTLTAGARSSRLSATLKQLNDISALYIGHVVKSDPDVVSQGNQAHRLLLEAFERRDVEAAISVCIAHLQTTRRASQKALIDSNDTLAPKDVRHQRSTLPPATMSS